MVWPTPMDNKMKNFNMTELPGHMVKAELAPNYHNYMLNLDIDTQLACCRLTGIWAALGKSTNSVEIIEKMIEAGMNIAIINMSFGTTTEHLELIEMAREAARNYSTKVGTKFPLAIGMILAGKKVRTGKCSPVYEDKIELREKDTVRLTSDDAFMDRCSAQTIYVDFPGFLLNLQKGDEIVLDNEVISLRVEVISFTTVTCKVERGGILGSYKDIYIPGRSLDMPDLNKNDKENIKMAASNKLDLIIISFVKNAQAVNECRKVLGKKEKKVKIIANIQTLQGYQNYNEILQVADGVFISRQELGLDVGVHKLLIVQKDMVTRAFMANVPVVIACHLMTTMRYASTPATVDEIDIGNCVLDGVDGFYLSAETAVGKHPIETIENLARACKEAEICMWSKQIYNELVSKTEKPCNHMNAVAIGAVLAAQNCLATMIIVATVTGNTAKLISKYRPRCPIVAVSQSIRTCRAQQMYRGIVPLCFDNVKSVTSYDWREHHETRQNFAIKWAIQQGLIRECDPIVSVYGRRHGTGNTNSIRVMYVRPNKEEKKEDD